MVDSSVLLQDEAEAETMEERACSEFQRKRFVSCIQLLSKAYAKAHEHCAGGLDMDVRLAAEAAQAAMGMAYDSGWDRSVGASCVVEISMNNGNGPARAYLLSKMCCHPALFWMVKDILREEAPEILR